MRRWVIVGIVLFAAPALAAKVKAELLCGVFSGKKAEYTLPTDDGRKIDKPIDCLLALQGGARSAPVRIHTWLAGAGPAHEGTISRAESFEAILQPGAKLDGKSDFVPCSDDFEIVAEIGPEGSPLWSERIKVHQECAHAPPAPSMAPSPARATTPIPAKFATGDLDGLPDDGARDAAKKFADAALAGDGAAAARLCDGAGVRSGKKTIACDAIASRGAATAGWKPVCCAGGGGCTFGEWGATAHSATEVWVTNSNGCVGAMIPVAVLRRKGPRWLWTEVQTLQNGE